MKIVDGDIAASNTVTFKALKGETVMIQDATHYESIGQNHSDNGNRIPRVASYDRREEGMNNL